MGAVKFHVRDELKFWACNGEKFEGGKWHEVDWTADELALVAAAEAQGSLDEVQWDRHGAPADVVESDEDSLKKLNEAMATGDWQLGNELQAVLDAYHKVEVVELDEDDELEVVEKEGDE